MKRKFWMVKGDGWQQLIQEDEAPDDVEDYTDDEGATIELCENPSGEDLAGWMDNEAENANRHSLVGVHNAVYKLIVEHGSTEVADKVFRALADDNKNYFGDD